MGGILCGLKEPERSDPGSWYNPIVFELIDEREDATGTHWTVQVIDVEGGLRKTGVRLAWADYDIYSWDRFSPISHRCYGLSPTNRINSRYSCNLCSCERCLVN